MTNCEFLNEAAYQSVADKYIPQNNGPCGTFEFITRNRLRELLSDYESEKANQTCTTENPAQEHVYIKMKVIDNSAAKAGYLSPFGAALHQLKVDESVLVTGTSMQNACGICMNTRYSTSFRKKFSCRRTSGGIVATRIE